MIALPCRVSWRRILIGGLTLLTLTSCGDSDQATFPNATPTTPTAAPTGATGGGAGNGPAASNATPTQGQENQVAWAFAPTSVALSCDDTPAQALARKAPHVTFGDHTILVGFQQINGTDQDPIVARYDGGTKIFCEHSKKGGGVDGRAYGVSWDGANRLYVVYTIVGGGTLFDQAAKGAWLDSYGDGGASAKATVIGAVNAQTGVVEQATFVVSKLLKNGQLKTNTLTPPTLVHVLADGTLEFFGNAAYCSLNPDKSPMCAVGSSTDYPKNYRAHFTPDLKQMLCASATGVSTVKQPCP